MIRKNSHRFPKTLVLVSIAALGLVASTAISTLATSFSKRGSMNAARDGHNATLLANGEVLVTGGDNYTDGFLSSVELYNPATRKWTSRQYGCRAREPRRSAIAEPPGARSCRLQRPNKIDDAGSNI
jgi:hypothetical protein